MQQRDLGRSGLRVSEVSLGTMTWGEQNSQAEAFEQLDCAIANGVNFIDAAELYPVPPRAETQGETERILGNWLQRRGQRDDLVIASKIAGPRGDLQHIRGGTGGFGPAEIERALDASLTRLQTDYLDLYYLHWPQRRTNYFGRLGYEHHEEPIAPLEESLQALKAQYDAGKIRAIGLSNETPWGLFSFIRLAEQIGAPPIATIQNPYSLLNRTFEVGLAEIAIREQCPLSAYSPLAFGVLSGKYLDGATPADGRLTLFPYFDRYSSDNAAEATAAYTRIAREHDLDPSQMAIRYIIDRPFAASAIVGATTLAQLECNLGAATVTLDEEVVAQIEEVHKRIPNPSP